ncbi:MAG: peptide transporter substrate-binding protein [Dehalococcoidia bacterium]|nr:peptide transporter substrate-binding protein [Dehalococcoidia bacterium]
MSNIQTRLALMLVGLSMVLAVACAPAATPATSDEKVAPGDQPASATTGTETPRRGGILVKSNGASSYAGMDPAMGQMSYNWNPQIALYMMKKEPETSQVKGDAIESWEFSKDGKELTLHLRKGLKFFDKPPVNGREVEAKDIIYSLKSMSGELYPELSQLRFPRKAEVEAMSSAVAVDKYTVKITLSHVDPYFPDALAEYRSAIVLPEGIREAFGGVEALTVPSVDRFIYGGPFIPTKFNQLTEIQYTRNPNYWKQGQPYLDGIHEIWIPDSSTEKAAFIAGQIDFIATAGESDKAFVLKGKPGTRIQLRPASSWSRIMMNVKKKPFDDVRVRQAIALVVNPVEIGQTLAGDWEGKPLWKLPGPIPWVFPEALSQEELAKMPQYEHPKSQATIDKARQLLKEAGYEKGFEFEMMGSASIRDYGVIAQAQIEKALPGVKITIRPQDNAINLNRAAKGDYEAQAYPPIHQSNGLSQIATFYHSKGGRNQSNFSDSKMDKLIEDAGAELDSAKRTALLNEAQLYAIEMAPYVPIWHYSTSLALQPWLRGLRLGGAVGNHMSWAEDIWFTSTPKR